MKKQNKMKTKASRVKQWSDIGSRVTCGFYVLYIKLAFFLESMSAPGAQ